MSEANAAFTEHKKWSLQKKIFLVTWINIGTSIFTNEPISLQLWILQNLFDRFDSRECQSFIFCTICTAHQNNKAESPSLQLEIDMTSLKKIHLER